MPASILAALTDTETSPGCLSRLTQSRTTSPVFAQNGSAQVNGLKVPLVLIDLTEAG